VRIHNGKLKGESVKRFDIGKEPAKKLRKKYGHRIGRIL